MGGLFPMKNAVTGETEAAKPRATVGAYYFDGWSGKNSNAEKAEWAKDAPTHLTKRMLDEFPGREPVWGWRDDKLEIMERQIDLAADHGINFFAFCWYFRNTQKEVDNDPKHTCLKLFLEARNNNRMQFCLLVANHEGAFIGGPENWKKAAEYWMPYLKHKQHVRVDGKPLILIFNPKDSSKEGLDILQAAAKENGLPGVAFAACGKGDPKTGYALRTYYNIVPGYASGSEKHAYPELIQAHQKAGWDKRPWEGPTGLNQKLGWYFPDRTPEAFGQFVRSAVDWMDKNPKQATKERLMLIYAWNELGEGGYIAPTHDDPNGGYLKALKAAVSP
jgi:hypothetical protein